MSKKPRPTQQYIRENRKEIRKQIRLFREKKGYSRDELAEIMEVDRFTVLKVESGKFAARIDYLVSLAWYLDFDISVLYKKAV